MKINKIYNYNGFKIQNSPYLHNEPRWFIYDKDMKKLDTYPKKTLKDAKSYVDDLLEE